MTSIEGETEAKKPGRQAHRVAPGRLEVRPNCGAFVCEYMSAADNGPQAIGSDPWWAAAKVCGFVRARLKQAETKNQAGNAVPEVMIVNGPEIMA